jgi:hypothetical protein
VAIDGREGQLPGHEELSAADHGYQALLAWIQGMARSQRSALKVLALSAQP